MPNPFRLSVALWFLGSELAAAWITPQHGVTKSPLRWPDATKKRLIVHASISSEILVIGGTGFVGRHIVGLLDRRNIPYIATSTQGQDGTIALDLTNEDAAEKLSSICQKNGVSAIVSTAGSIFTENDYEINSASGRTAAAAFGSSPGETEALPKYIFIGNTPRVRNVCGIISSLKEYGRGKQESEQLIEETFAQKSCIIKPTFIYGGNDFGLKPPRLPTGLGAIVEAILGLYPVQATSEFLPDLLGVPLEAPVNVESVAGAAVNVATGLCLDTDALDSRENIIMAASKRPPIELTNNTPEMNERRDKLKTTLSTQAREHTPEENFAMLEQLERLKPNSTRPTDDSSLNGRWEFCFDVEPDVGTGFIKELFEGNGPDWLRKIIDFEGVHMEIGNGQTTIQLVVSVALFEKEITLILHTSLSPAESNPGTMFMEKFEGIELNGFRLPYPSAWKKSRFLEFSYLDEEFAIARGAGGEPHFLLRGE
mmetsp:Transcript_26615/g.56239  ORF Transcript_26615/g.56239 Transcript_26615/m.56239 type:complete len:483 (+) Transcript_26615:37-1485(+)